MNDFFDWRLIYISSTQHVDLISGFKTSQKFTDFNQSISETSDEISSALKSQTLTFGQLFQDKTFSNIKILQMIHHDHKKSKNLEKSTKSQNFQHLENFDFLLTFPNSLIF